jgi:glycosyltransferase involved in cell wall biosynthesis
MRTMCEMAVKGGFEVACLCTTAAEHSGLTDAYPPPYSFRGVNYATIHVGASMNWERKYSSRFLSGLNTMLETFGPDLVLLYGGSHPDMTMKWIQRSIEAGARVIFGLRNLEYRDRTLLDEADALLACSDFTRDYYKRTLGVDSTSIPVPIDPDDCIAKDRTPKYVTIVNPSREKGQLFIARFVQEMAKHCPEIPIQIFESRGTRAMLELASGMKLQRHPSQQLVFRPIVSLPSQIYQETRVLLVPSVWEEPAGRVVAEAMLNGVVPIVSDRGGLQEMCNASGYTIRLPKWYTIETREVLPTEEVQHWIDLVVNLFQDEVMYAWDSEVAKTIGDIIYGYSELQAEYVAFFRSQLSKS